jgi:hypothetical protein
MPVPLLLVEPVLPPYRPDGRQISSLSESLQKSTWTELCGDSEAASRIEPDAALFSAAGPPDDNVVPCAPNHTGMGRSWRRFVQCLRVWGQEEPCPSISPVSCQPARTSGRLPWRSKSHPAMHLLARSSISSPNSASFSGSSSCTASPCQYPLFAKTSIPCTFLMSFAKLAPAIRAAPATVSPKSLCSLNRLDRPTPLARAHGPPRSTAGRRNDPQALRDESTKIHRQTRIARNAGHEFLSEAPT